MFKDWLSFEIVSEFLVEKFAGGAKMGGRSLGCNGGVSPSGVESIETSSLST